MTEEEKPKIRIITGKGNGKKENDCSGIAKQLYKDSRNPEMMSCFVAVGISPENELSFYCGNNENDPKGILEVLGAIHILNRYAYDAMDEDAYEEREDE